jgi:methylenetetrahydrofolate dehydrogenase (NADP+)/methenyltetrahydrofolate cyclohydrolase
MLVDGKKIASDLLLEVSAKVSKLEKTPRLSAITCAPNFETQKYLEMKKKKAASVGVILNVVELPEDARTEDVLSCLREVCKVSDGVVVQLPLPPQIDRDKVLESIPVDKDPDGFKFGVVEAACLSPVVGAIDEISRRHGVDWEDKKVVILGEGRLVGVPCLHYVHTKKSQVEIFNKDNFVESKLEDADIIITGIGQPNFIRDYHIKNGVVIFDAGTSEDGGVLVGDVSIEVGHKASLLTPVPGGIGPITIAYLLRNLVDLVV